MAAAVERDVYALFDSRIEQTLPHRVFPYRPNKVSVANAIHRFLPGLTKVVGLKNVRTQVVQRIPVDRDVGSTGVEVRRLNEWNQAPLRDRGRGNILPSRATVARQLDRAVVATSPNNSFFHRRWSNRHQRA